MPPLCTHLCLCARGVLRSAVRQSQEGRARFTVRSLGLDAKNLQYDIYSLPTVNSAEQTLGAVSVIVTGRPSSWFAPHHPTSPTDLSLWQPLLFVPITKSLRLLWSPTEGLYVFLNTWTKKYVCLFLLTVPDDASFRITYNAQTNYSVFVLERGAPLCSIHLFTIFLLTLPEAVFSPWGSRSAILLYSEIKM